MAGSRGPFHPGRGRTRRRPLCRVLLRLEELETRTLLSVFTPAQIRHAYGIDQVSANGAGQTIAIIDAYDAPRIATDLQTFDRQFGLPNPPSFSKVNEYGGNAMPSRNAQWETEISLDVEWAHAIAPGANLLLVEANSASVQDMLTAVTYASKQTGVVAVSMSWGTSEFSNEALYDSYFTTPAGHMGSGNSWGGIIYVAAAGDGGSAAGPTWPSVSPNVLAVGGTSLTLSGAGSYQSESGWSNGGGGISKYEPEPSYQKTAQTSGWRTTPDVAYDADPGTGYYVYQSSSSSGWLKVGGTSAAAAQWAGIIALADQMRNSAGLGALGGINLSPMMFYIMSPPLHDVTTGNNGHAAGPGYDLVTGLGTPIGNLLVPFLATGSISPAPVLPGPTYPPITQPVVPSVPKAPTTPATGPPMHINVQAHAIVQSIQAPVETLSQSSVSGSKAVAMTFTVPPPLSAFSRADQPTAAGTDVGTISLTAPVAFYPGLPTIRRASSRTQGTALTLGVRPNGTALAFSTLGGGMLLDNAGGRGVSGPEDRRVANGTAVDGSSVALNGTNRPLWVGFVSPVLQAVVGLRIHFGSFATSDRQGPASAQAFSPAVMAAALAVILADLGYNPAFQVEDTTRRRAWA